mmetsp:Transcript_15296/g.41900  ORF Transcript_15296/g.41900 Transcript_15296/m.41900 type:complete len:852 (-) Transcript_15296:126-2681(-)
MLDVGHGRADDGLASRSTRTGGWREAFLNRQHDRRSGSCDRNQGASEAFLSRHRDRRAASCERDRGPAEARSLSRPRERRAPAADAGGEAGFDQQAVLDQDRALIEQLTQRQPRRERSIVRKPPPPPKVTPYRQRSDSVSGAPGGEGTSAPPSPAAGSSAATPPAAMSATQTPTSAAGGPPLDASASPEAAVVPESPTAATDVAPVSQVPRTPPSWNGEAVVAQEAAADVAQAADPPAATVDIEPIVPRSGQLFTAADIDNIMDRLDGAGARRGDGTNGAGAVPLQYNALQQSARAQLEQCVNTQTISDISQECLRSQGLEAAATNFPNQGAQLNSQEALNVSNVSKAGTDFAVPQRKKLQEQIQAIDSWLEDDIYAREQLSNKPAATPFMAPPGSTLTGPTDASATLRELTAAMAGGGDGAEAEIFKKLEDMKRQKALGEKPSTVVVKSLATQAKPLLPGMSLEKLVRVLRLFTSARHEDHDLYLRILGEIPVQIRGISTEMLTTCVRVLWRLRLHEATYLELFSMEAMNMIRAKRRGPPRAPPRRPPPPRSVAVDMAATAAVSSGAVPTPAPPSREVPAPFSATELLHLGNALSRLGSKPPARFLDVYQEQLTLAMPNLTQEECELVCPTLAMSQLMPDALRRSYLERCSQVDAGGSPPVGAGQRSSGGAAPDIAQYQREAEQRRRRLKHFRNIFIIEASVRKETFSFFSSLPAEVRTYLDGLHKESAKLPHEGQGALAQQVAAVLDQLGVSCDMKRMAGPLGLHVVAKATNPRADCEEIVYECSDASAFYSVRQDDQGALPEMTAFTKLRHRLLQRLGVKLTHISVWEWQQLSEAQRVNYMVKLQSLQ